jgi:hypothetical protein
LETKTIAPMMIHAEFAQDCICIGTGLVVDKS